VLATRSALDADGQLLAGDERAAVEALIERLVALAASDDAEGIERGTEALAQGTEEFAARRMNEGIRRALAGRRLDQV
jgi:molecular chaperone HscA